MDVLHEFLDNNSVDNNYPTSVLNFLNSVLTILANNSLSEDEQFEQFIQAYDLFDPMLNINTPQIDFEAKIRYYANEFRRRGQHSFADYLDSLVPFQPGTTMGDIFDFFDEIRAENLRLTYKYLRAIVTTNIDSFEPVVKLALLVVGGRFALYLLQKLPSAYVTAHIATIISRLGIPASTAFTAFQHAQKFGIQTYAQLQQEFINLGISASSQNVQFHHLIEQRFSNVQGVSAWLGSTSTANWQSIVLTPQEHQVFTNAWRAAISTNNMSNLGWTQVQIQIVPH